MPDMDITKKPLSKLPAFDKDINKSILKKIPPGQIPMYLFYLVCISVISYILFSDLPVYKAIIVIVIILILAIVTILAIKYYYSGR